MHAAGRELLVPATVIAEVGYLLAREAGSGVESLFLASLAAGDFVAGELATPRHPPIAPPGGPYRDLPPGTTHRPAVRRAGRRKRTDVATLDRRHFTVVRPSHVNSLTLLP